MGGLPGSWVEIDPRAVCANVDEVLSILAAQAPEADTVFVSGQMGGVILLDEQVQPLTNYLSWRDQRTLSATPSGNSYLDHVRTRWETAD